MIPYLSKYSKLPGTSYREVYSQAMHFYKSIENRTRRKPYVKSKFFNKQKIFFDYYWPHLWKSVGYKERVRRLKFFNAAIDLLKNSNKGPDTKENPNNSKELLHRFAGLTKEKEQFYVQVKENKRTGRKHFISCFPTKN